ncbi:MAG: hypothetical protein RMM53_06130 [Bacteroidia bacterium]|nr:hypothetical protein [Bacteroidia bacterium]MDW8333773.1 hypothetical protein [Bacteroidia bacterium]
MKFLDLYLPIVSATVFYCAAVNAFAQSNPLKGRDTLVLENFRIEGLPDSYKQPAPFPEERLEPRKGEKIDVEAPDLPIRPPVPALQYPLELMPKTQWEKLYNNYLRLGFGMYLSPLVDLFVQNGRNPKFDAGLNFRHRSSIAGHVPFARFGDNEIGARIAGYGGKHTAYLRTGFHHYAYNAYGDSIAVVEQDLQQLRERFIRTDLTAGVYRHFNSKFVYGLETQLKLYNDRRANTEFHATFSPEVKFRLFDSLRVQLETFVTVSAIKQPTFSRASLTQAFWDLTPALSYARKRMSFSAGLRLNAFAREKTRWAVYPTLEIRAVLVPKHLDFVAGISGRSHYYTRYALIAVNSWLDERALVLSSRETYNIYANAGGAIEGFSYRLSGFHRRVQGMPVFYSPDEDGVEFGLPMRQGRFQILYENGFTETALALEAGYSLKERLRAGAKIEYSLYGLEDLKHYFNMPAFRAHAWCGGTLFKKLYLETQWYFYGPRPMGYFRPTNESSPSLVVEPFVPDANLKIEYRFSDRFSVFAQGGNLIYRRYVRWRHYLERRIDVRAGLTLSF